MSGAIESLRSGLGEEGSKRSLTGFRSREGTLGRYSLRKFHLHWIQCSPGISLRNHLTWVPYSFIIIIIVMSLSQLYLNSKET